MFATRTLLSLSPFLDLNWQKGCRDCALPSLGTSPIHHLIVNGPTCLELIMNTETFLLGKKGVFQEVPNARSLEDLKRAAVRQHLIDCTTLPQSSLDVHIRCFLITDKCALISLLSAHFQRPVDYDIPLHRVITTILHLEKTPIVVH